MILVTVGSSQFPFDRLLHAVDALPRGEQLVVQHGPSDVRPTDANCVPYMPFERFGDLVREARVVVTHAGVGSILVSLGPRQAPVRRAAPTGLRRDRRRPPARVRRRFAEAGLVTLVEDPEALADVVAANGGNGAAALGARGTSALVAELRGYLGEKLGPPGTAS